MATQRIKLWDLPTRLFHWLLVPLVVAAIITAKTGGNAMVWHGRIGLAILGLVVFRIVWGLVGSTYARFLNFLPTPGSIAAYLRGQWHGLGHNPLGALSVFGMLAMLAVQVGTGLFANDDIAFQGPLAAVIDKEFSDTLTGYHKLSIKIVLALIALHVSAIAFYAFIKKDDLVRPMISGWKTMESDTAADDRSARGGGPLALGVAVIVALAAAYAASGAWLGS